MVNTYHDDLSLLLEIFAPITLVDVDRVALQNRREAKYIVPMATLCRAIPTLSDDYSVLSIEDARLHQYRTLYFDTDDFDMYHRHHAGSLNRYKIRAREYVESQTTFLEIKYKTNKRRTEKCRYPTPCLITEPQVTPDLFRVEQCPYPPDCLFPRVWNHYRRFTLVNRQIAERVTVDVDMRFASYASESADSSHGQQEHFSGPSVVDLAGVAIVEVKQEGRPRGSAFMDSLRELQIRRTGFSKYCIGASMLYPALKSNRFKATQRLLAKLMEPVVYASH